MCGIAGIYFKDSGIGRYPVNEMINRMLLGIEHRGWDATGFVAVDSDNKLTMNKKALTASEYIQQRPDAPEDSKIVLLHTRLATQGDKSNANNNHPVWYNDCFAVHNGHIYNDDEVFRTLEIPRMAEVDSEAIPAALSFHGMNSIPNIQSGLNELSGNIATAAVDPTNAPGTLVLAKGSSSPLYVLNTRRAILFASEPGVMTDMWARAIGTCPQAQLDKFKPDFNCNGLWESTYGDLMVIKDDEIILDRWSPKARSYSYTSYSPNGRSSYTNSLFGDDDDWEYASYTPTQAGNDKPNDHGEWVNIGGETRYVATTTPEGKKFTCYPTFETCVNPCKVGCASVACHCFEGSVLHPGMAVRPMDNVVDLSERRAIPQTCSAPEAGDVFSERDGDDCEVCWGWTPADRLSLQQNEVWGERTITVCDRCSGTELRLERIHRRCIASVAADNEVEPGFVENLLFNSDVRDRSEKYPNLKELIDRFEKEYQETQGVMEASAFHDGAMA
jgi:amidophosphoribosyltransferase